MKALILILAFTATVAATPRTMRLDYYHTGDSKQELFSVDRIVIEPLPWPGNPHQVIDKSNLGKYVFEVKDQKTGRLLYSRGFASIYGEWETTDEAQKMVRTFHESLRFPAPEATVELVLKKRDAKNVFREVWTTIVDPKSIFVDRSKSQAPATVIEIQKMGDPATKVDLLLMGDGYTAAEGKKFESDARRLTEALFATSPFKERRKDFNVWAICPPALESGISRPSTGIHHDSPLGTTYDAFGSERYVLTFDNRAVRKTAAFAPYEFIEILVNNRTYGGGGIFNLYSTVAVDSAWAAYLFIHEFGHHFAALADEYYTSPVAYAPVTVRIEPWEPNVTALLDPLKLKWRDLVSADTPVPTPWAKEIYENRAREIQRLRQEIRKEQRPEEDMEALFTIQAKAERTLFDAERYAGKVGAFEGAMYEAKGFYRPQVDCIMFSRSDSFCSVCRRAVERVIDLYTAKL